MPLRRPLIVIGVGGHGRVLMDIVRVRPDFRLAAVVDDRFTEPELRGGLLYGPISTVPSLLLDEPDAELVIGIGDNRIRRQIAERLGLADEQYAALVHPGAYVSSDAQLGAGAVVMPGAVIGPGAVVGAHAIVNSGAVVEHDAVVGDFAHVSPNATLAGGAVVEEGAHVGSGAVLIPGVRLGRWSVLGAGGTAIRDLPDGITAVGVPAVALAR
ncbi:acetyltransferase [Paenibacillus sp. GCM10023252]|uniref:acetyltransferase n=1 Tax=Paenibacillus sp. GCM10023252 TaxID=3252649 RepID=UPI00361CA3B5